MADHGHCILGVDLRVCISPVSFSPVRMRVLNRGPRTCTSSMYVMIYGQITEEFHCSTLVATVGLSTYVFGLGKSSLSQKSAWMRETKG